MAIVWDARYGPHPDERGWKEIQRVSEKFMESIVERFKGGIMDGAVLRLKCVVTSVKSVAQADGEKYQEEVGLSAVSSGSESNKQWSKWTPCANISMSISNPAAFGKVLPGQFFFVDLIPTDKES
jgi:hypothetical protein